MDQTLINLFLFKNIKNEQIYYSYIGNKLVDRREQFCITEIKSDFFIFCIKIFVPIITFQLSEVISIYSFFPPYLCPSFYVTNIDNSSTDSYIPVV